MKGIVETIIKSKVYLAIIIIFTIILLIGCGLIIRNILNGPDRLTTSSCLADLVPVNKISGIKYVHTGAAPIYKNDKKTKIDCHVKYDARVNVNVNLDEVQYTLNTTTKEMLIKLPELSIEVTLKDDETLSFIPKEQNLDLGKVRDACREHAISTARESNTFNELAIKNIKTTIEAMLMPLLMDEEYKIVWEN